MYATNVKNEQKHEKDTFKKGRQREKCREMQ